ncbi:hypothetical protein FDG92_gp44 [Arthrobacter phage Jasmine]|uniref:Uncharacterized protein n=1 Tax=Arthrobacter phage Jasmine TaxID=1772302 RepID=A0A0U4K858_9CAUD|nr:hypothetical protein FDG92_gp44 [Arthrobacter phage Jasmine]ALY09315.1 hypothetical protein JASMINE_45 [Arthrobacter phage Jasmine]
MEQEMFGAPIVRWDSRNPSAYGRMIVAGRRGGKTQRQREWSSLLFDEILETQNLMNKAKVRDYIRTQSPLAESVRPNYIQSRWVRFANGHGRNNAVVVFSLSLDAQGDRQLIFTMDQINRLSTTRETIYRLSALSVTIAGTPLMTSFILSLDQLMEKRGYQFRQKVNPYPLWQEF